MLKVLKMQVDFCHNLHYGFRKFKLKQAKKKKALIKVQSLYEQLCLHDICFFQCPKLW